MARRLLILEDETIFGGKAFRVNLDVTGEIVFDTGMTDYQESITSRSYNGQILTFTYPLIGSCSVNRDDYESITSTYKGVAVSESAHRVNSWRNQMTLDESLKIKNIPGISGIDTHALTKVVRKHETMKATFASGGDSIEHLQIQLRAIVLPTNNTGQVSAKTAYPAPGADKSIVLVDFGLKHSVLRELSKRDCNMTVVPCSTMAEEILHLNPDGVMLPNGPGNPGDVLEALDTIHGVQGRIPIFGICVGHQLFSLANGATTYKIKFGHRGSNHAAREIATGHIDFTSQNHGYAVDRDALPNCLMVTYEEVDGKSIEGVRHCDFPAFSAQFHPDVASGPHDTGCPLDDSFELIDAFRARKAHN